MGCKAAFAPGDRRGKFTVLEIDRVVGQATWWRCQCDCGKIVTKITSRINQAAAQNSGCGCRKLVGLKAASEANVTHGETGSRLFIIRGGMIQRCTNSNDDAYADYGARGITICEEWRTSYVAFRDWAFANGYRDDLCIDRIDNDRGYEPGNCRWTDMLGQAHNRRTARKRARS